MNLFINLWNTVIAATALIAISLTITKIIDEPLLFTETVIRRYCFFLTSLVLGLIISCIISAISDCSRRALAFLYLQVIAGAAIVFSIFFGK